MNEDHHEDSLSFDHPIWSSLFLLGFGVAILLFLVAIERQNWFHIKPMSGAAAAMSYAADKGDKPRP